MSAEVNAHGRSRLAAIAACTFIAVSATILRFWCKIHLKNGIHADDWWMLLAVLAYLGAQSALLWGFIDGTSGKQMDEIMQELALSPSPKTVKGLQNYLESLFIGYSLSCFLLYAIKMSICLLYQRIFSTPRLRWACWCLMGISTAWFIATEVTNILTCIPVQTFWVRPPPGQPAKGKCLNFNVFFLVSGIAETIIDTSILILPIRAIYGLKMATRTKFLVASIFLLGGFAIITNVLRVYYTYIPNGFYVDFDKAELWSEIHIATSIACACSPVYSPLRKKLGHLVTLLHSYSRDWRFRLSDKTTDASSRSRFGAGQIDNMGQAPRHDMDLFRHDPTGGSKLPFTTYSGPFDRPGDLAAGTIVERKSDTTGDAGAPPTRTITRTRELHLV